MKLKYGIVGAATKVWGTTRRRRQAKATRWWKRGDGKCSAKGERAV